MSGLDTSSQREVENLRIAELNSANVSELLIQKRRNEEKAANVGTVVATQLQSMLQQARKLEFIKTELAKLDLNLSRNSKLFHDERARSRSCLCSSMHLSPPTRVFVLAHHFYLFIAVY